MSRTCKLVVWAVLLLPCAARSAPRASDAVRFRVDAGYPASLYYLIDNMAGGSFRASAYYWEFWRKRYGLGDGDRAALERYRGLRDAFEAGRGSGDAWALLFAGSRDLDEVWAKAAERLPAKDARALKAVVLRFDRKFRPYWNKHGGYLAREAARFESDGMPAKIAAFLARVAGVLELPGDFTRDDLLVLAWHPGLKISANMMHGFRLGRVLIVELPEGVGYEDQVDVAVHELVHDLFAAVPKPVRLALSERALNGDQRSGLFFLQGMNEGLATALGQGAFMAENFPKKFDPGGAWYASGVDAFAKAIFPEIRRALEADGTLRSSEGAMIAALKPLAERAKLGAFFKSHVLLTDGADESLVESLFNALDVGSVDHYSPNADPAQREEARRRIVSDPARPVVAMLEPRSLHAPLTDLLDGMLDGDKLATVKKLAAGRAVAVVSRSKSGRLYLLLLGTKEQLEDGLAILPALDYPAAGAVYSLTDGRPLSTW